MNSDHAIISMTLFSDQGEPKYLNSTERGRFYRCRKIIRDLSERTFVEMLFWTGCRVSEALQLVVARVNVHDSFVVFRTLKQHGKNKGKRFRIVHLPYFVMWRLNRVHKIVRAQRNEFSNKFRLLWNFGRQKAWRLVKRVMDKARIFGARATAKGLRHSFGVNSILRGVSVAKLQEWLGHQDIKTTTIYVKISGAEDRALARRTWKFWEVYA